MVSASSSCILRLSCCGGLCVENERLKGLVSFVQSSKIAAVGARVIGRPTNSWEGVITIDRGTADSVQVGMPVVGAAGALRRAAAAGRLP